MILNRIFFGIFGCMASGLALASASIGDFATELMTPTEIVGNSIAYGALILGIMAVVASVLRYVEYRRNPFTTTLSSVFMLFIVGLILCVLPIFHLMNEAKIFNIY